MEAVFFLPQALLTEGNKEHIVGTGPAPGAGRCPGQGGVVGCLLERPVVEPERKRRARDLVRDAVGSGAVVAGQLHGSRTWPPGLPMPLTALIGRERDLKEVTALLAGNRLVTLVGSGGVGKTRLAIETAAAIAPRFADGVDLVDLGGVPDPGLVWAAVAQAVGVEERADADLAWRLAGVLRPQSRLLVLDNCEHLLAGCASVATRLLGCCPELRILVTSREGLGVPGEVT